MHTIKTFYFIWHIVCVCVGGVFSVWNLKGFLNPVYLPEQNEVPETKKEESLLDLDFDPFKPDAVATVAAPSPMSQVFPLFEGCRA